MKFNLQECALCKSHDKLESSHIVPKMVVRKLKKTAFGSIRNTQFPNITIQDGEKHNMLCGNCEDLFSTYETYFANSLFHPYLNKVTDTFEYDERLFNCLTSISWRSLYLDLIDFVHNHVIGLPALTELIRCEEIMRKYLLKQRDDIDHIENHVFFFDEIKEIYGANRMSFLKYPHSTFHRSITSYTFCYEKDPMYGTITNMLGLVLFTIYTKPQTEKWKNTKIYRQGGVIKAKNQQIKSVAGNELIAIMDTCQKATESLSIKQKDKLLKKNKNIDFLFTNSSLYNDLKLDFELE